MALNFQGQTLTDVAKELPLDRLDQLTIAKIQDRILRVDTLPSLAARGRTPGGAMFSDEFYFYDESPHVEADGQHGYYETWDPWSLTDGWDGEEGYLTEGHWDHSVQHGCQMPTRNHRLTNPGSLWRPWFPSLGLLVGEFPSRKGDFRKRKIRTKGSES